jgi:hypothetical protein
MTNIDKQDFKKIYKIIQNTNKKKLNMYMKNILLNKPVKNNVISVMLSKYNKNDIYNILSQLFKFKPSNINYSNVEETLNITRDEEDDDDHDDNDDDDYDEELNVLKYPKFDMTEDNKILNMAELLNISKDLLKSSEDTTLNIPKDLLKSSEDTTLNMKNNITDLLKYSEDNSLDMQKILNSTQDNKKVNITDLLKSSEDNNNDRGTTLKLSDNDAKVLELDEIKDLLLYDKKPVVIDDKSLDSVNDVKLIIKSLRNITNMLEEREMYLLKKEAELHEKYGYLRTLKK